MTRGPQPWHDETWRQKGKPGMKRSADDRRFSREIRERDNHTCQRCGTSYPDKSKGLHCAHMFSRGKLATRFDPANARALCYGCHRYLDTHPNEKREFFKEWLGEEAFAALELRSNVPYKTPAPAKPQSEKPCTKCQRVLPVTQFHLVARTKSGSKPRFASRCKECAKEDHKIRRQDPEQALRNSVKKYGLSLEEYREWVDAQDNRCAICDQLPSGTRNNKRLHIDHDARTGEVRGLLCGKCNTALGLLNEDIVRFHMAMEYLRDAEDERRASA